MEEKTYSHFTKEKNLEEIYETKMLFKGSWFTPNPMKGLTSCQIKRNLELDDVSKGKCELRCKMSPSQLIEKDLTSGGFPQFQLAEPLPIQKCTSKCEGDINLLVNVCIWGGCVYLFSYLFTKDRAFSSRIGYAVAFLKFLDEILC